MTRKEPGMDTRTRILIVEDEKIVAEDIHDRLLTMGYAVTGIAMSGTDAIALAESTRPDLILMDIRLDGPMDGIETAEKIRRRAAVPVLFLTAYSDPHTIHRAILSEPFGYLHKPVENRELYATIEIALYKFKVEQRIKNNELRQSALLSGLSEGVIAADSEGFVDYLNRTAQLLTGWSAEDALGKKLEEVVGTVGERTDSPPDEYAAHAGQHGGAGRTGLRQILIRRDGKRIPVDVTVSPMTDPAGAVIGRLLTIRDASESRRIEEASRKLSKRILDAQESERRRVSRELHDGVIQLLSSILFKLRGMRDTDGCSMDSINRDLGSLDDLLERTMVEVRRISRNLRPSELDDLGIIPALRAACSEFQGRTGITVDFQHSGISDSLAPEIKLALYRVAQEALTNTEKHARATQVSLHLFRRRSMIILMITDNGIGFAAQYRDARTTEGTGLGVINMAERAGLIGGTISINRVPTGGTEIILRIPMHARPTTGIVSQAHGQKE